jgi:hypothetical protein
MGADIANLYATVRLIAEGQLNSKQAQRRAQFTIRRLKSDIFKKLDAEQRDVLPYPEEDRS